MVDFLLSHKKCSSQKLLAAGCLLPSVLILTGSIIRKSQRASMDKGLARTLQMVYTYKGRERGII